MILQKHNLIINKQYTDTASDKNPAVTTHQLTYTIN